MLVHRVNSEGCPRKKLNGFHLDNYTFTFMYNCLNELSYKCIFMTPKTERMQVDTTLSQFLHFGSH